MKTISLKLSGRSGCKLEIIENNTSFIVRKFSKNIDYNQRLIIQAQKQKAFENILIFHAPKVLNIEPDTPGAYFDMEYIAGEKYSEHFARISKPEVDFFIENIISCIRKNVQESEMKKPDKSVFIGKVHSLKQELNLPDCETECLLNDLVAKIPDYPVPHGKCHGDLTFSNMIFSGSKVFLVDFLDSFFNSPMIDIVKLRQDTCFYWTLMVDTELEIQTRNKMMQIMKYYDQRLEHAFSKYDFFQPWYNYLQCFNLLRILPYIETKSEKDLVIEALNKVKI